MAKRYLGGGISFEQKDVYQEFSEDDTPSPGGSSTLAGLTDVDISNPSDGQTLVYNATSGKWENGSNSGGGDMFETLGTISAATVPMTYDEDSGVWVGAIESEILVPDYGVYAARNLSITVGGVSYSLEILATGLSGKIAVGETDELNLGVSMASPGDPIYFLLDYYTEGAEPVITNLTVEVYAPVPELAVFLRSDK